MSLYRAPAAQAESLGLFSFLFSFFTHGAFPSTETWHPAQCRRVYWTQLSGAQGEEKNKVKSIADRGGGSVNRLSVTAGRMLEWNPSTMGRWSWTDARTCRCLPSLPSLRWRWTETGENRVSVNTGLWLTLDNNDEDDAKFFEIQILNEANLKKHTNSNCCCCLDYVFFSKAIAPRNCKETYFNRSMPSEMKSISTPRPPCTIFVRVGLSVFKLLFL